MKIELGVKFNWMPHNSISVWSCTEKVFPMSLVKSIMQYTSVNPNIPSLKWGHLHEVSAKQEYVQIMKNIYQNFSV